MGFFRQPQGRSPISYPLIFSPPSGRRQFPRSFSSLEANLLHPPTLSNLARFSLLLLPSLLALSTLVSLTLTPFGNFNLDPVSIVNNAYVTLRLISYPLDSPHILPLLDSWDSKEIPRSFPWAGMAAADADVALLRPEGRFLYMTRGQDSCVGFNHFTASLSCRVELARKLRRVLVMDAVFCTPPEHSRGAKQGVVRPIYAYYDMDAVKRRVPFLTLQAFRKAMLDLNATMPTSPSSSSLFTLFSPRPTSPLSSISVAVLPGGHRLSVASAARLSSPAVVIWNQSMQDAAFMTCGHMPDIRETSWHLLWPQASLRIMAKFIAASINNSDFVAVHIRRGDKIKDPENWPHLDIDTRPESLLIRLPQLIPPGRAIYIATDETTPNFFAPLKQLYRVHTIDDFARFWSPGSEWHITYTRMLGDDITFDDTMRAIVDYGVTYLATRRVETFYDLTRDYKHGLMNCAVGVCL